MTILPLTYLGNTDYFAHIACEDCIIDIGENWIKQSARNRCEILSPNGVATLTVHVSGRGERIATKDVRIDYAKRWQHQHELALLSAYKKSPYYDYYAELFTPWFKRHTEFLADLNIGMLQKVVETLGIACPKISEDYVTATDGDTDLRGKKEFLAASPRTTSALYTQVFADRFGFIGGLSITDLLFCEGPDSLSLLKQHLPQCKQTLCR